MCVYIYYTQREIYKYERLINIIKGKNINFSCSYRLLDYLVFYTAGRDYICSKSISHNDIVESSDYHNSIFSEADESTKK